MAGKGNKSGGADPCPFGGRRSGGDRWTPKRQHCSFAAPDAGWHPFLFRQHRGSWIGALTPDNNKNALRRVRQYQIAGDEAFALHVARKIVHAKIRNSRRVLQRLSSDRQESADPDQQRTDSDLSGLADQAMSPQTLEELRGVEGWRLPGISPAWAASFRPASRSTDETAGRPRTLPMLCSPGLTPSCSAR